MSVIVNGGGGRKIDAVPTPNSNNPVASGGVYNVIASLPQPMVFKGTLGTGGTITTLPPASSSNEGFTYKVITDGTYASQTAKVGDVFVSNGTEWVLIPAGDEENDTWRNIKVNNTEILGNDISTGALNLKNGTNVSISADGGDVSISATDTTYESKSAVSGGTDVSLVTTGEKYTWYHKQNALTLPLSTSNGGTGNSDGYIRTGQKTNTTIGSNATAEGINTEASGSYSHAEGYETKASYACSHAEGENTTASGYTSHAEGYKTKASVDYSHAEGFKTQASAFYSHAEGYYTEASGVDSHAGGCYTIAGYKDQTIIGKYNDNKSTTLFEVGNGSSSTRSNAFEVHSNGNATVSGDLSVSGTVTGNAVETTPTSGSSKLITSGGVNTALAAKQNKLTAGTGISISSNNIISATGGGGGGNGWKYLAGGTRFDSGAIGHTNYESSEDYGKKLEIRVLSPQSTSFSTLNALISLIINNGVVLMPRSMYGSYGSDINEITWTYIGVTEGVVLLLEGTRNQARSFADQNYSNTRCVLKVSPGMVDSLTDSVSAWGGNLYKHEITIHFALPATYIARGGTHLHNGDYVIGWSKKESISW